jgi:hypothetical protein
MNFAIPEKSNLDLVDNGNSQGYQGYNIAQQGYEDYNQSPQQGYGDAQYDDYGNQGELVNQQSVHQQSGGGREYTGTSQTGSMGSGRSGGRTASEWAQDQEQFAHLPPLPPGWLRVLSRSTNKVYFCYPETGETTFTEPTGPPPSKLHSAEGNLPPGWTKMVSRSTGRTYYWHAGLQKSQFDAPTADSAAGAPPSPAGQTASNRTDPSLPAGWVQMVSRSTGKPYYFNTNTKQSQFERPQ